MRLINKEGLHTNLLAYYRTGYRVKWLTGAIVDRKITIIRVVDRVGAAEVLQAHVSVQEFHRTLQAREI